VNPAITTHRFGLWAILEGGKGVWFRLHDGRVFDANLDESEPDRTLYDLTGD
jgi:hypothetical protein